MGGLGSPSRVPSSKRSSRASRPVNFGGFSGGSSGGFSGNTGLGGGGGGYSGGGGARNLPTPLGVGSQAASFDGVQQLPDPVRQVGAPAFSGAQFGGSPFGGASFASAPMVSTAQANPELRAMEGRFGQAQNQAAALEGEIKSYGEMMAAPGGGRDQDAINAIQRQRDLASGMSKEAGMEAQFRVGGGTGLELQQQGDIYKKGLESMTDLNVGLTSDARRQQQGILGMRMGSKDQQMRALQGRQGATESTEAARRAQQQLGLAQFDSQQNAYNNWANTQARLQNQAFEQQMALASMYMS